MNEYRLSGSVVSVLVTVVLFIPFHAHGAYRIILKNDSSILVEDYMMVDGKIRFYRSGGFMEIDASDVKEIKETSEKVREKNEVGTAGVVEQETGGTPEHQDVMNREERLEEIRLKKESLRMEAEDLQKEIEKLKQEIRKEGRILAIRKKRELEKKKDDIEKRIQAINEEIERLDKEEESLFKEGGY